jgi:hypothetical protein
MMSIRSHVSCVALVLVAACQPVVHPHATALPAHELFTDPRALDLSDKRGEVILVALFGEDRPDDGCALSQLGAALEVAPGDVALVAFEESNGPPGSVRYVRTDCLAAEPAQREDWWTAPRVPVVLIVDRAGAVRFIHRDVVAEVRGVDVAVLNDEIRALVAEPRPDAPLAAIHWKQ